MLAGERDGCWLCQPDAAAVSTWRERPPRLRTSSTGIRVIFARPKKLFKLVSAVWPTPILMLAEQAEIACPRVALLAHGAQHKTCPDITAVVLCDCGTICWGTLSNGSRCP